MTNKAKPQILGFGKGFYEVPSIFSSQRRRKMTRKLLVAAVLGIFLAVPVMSIAHSDDAPASTQRKGVPREGAGGRMMGPGMMGGGMGGRGTMGFGGMMNPFSGTDPRGEGPGDMGPGRGSFPGGPRLPRGGMGGSR